MHKKNSAKAAIKAHGVQVLSITDNTFTQSAGIVIEHTNGEPRSEIMGNVFDKTPEPKITELHAKGAHTALLKNNKVK